MKLKPIGMVVLAIVAIMGLVALVLLSKNVQVAGKNTYQQQPFVSESPVNECTKYTCPIRRTAVPRQTAGGWVCVCTNADAAPVLTYP